MRDYGNSANVRRPLKNTSLANQRCNSYALLLIQICLIFSPSVSQAHVLGWLEWAWLQAGEIKIKAKLDSGAKTSSIDATDIEHFERDAKPWVRFVVPLGARLEDSDLKKNLNLERPLLRVIKVKDHVHESTTRYVVNIDLCVGGQLFTTPVSLTDRSRFNYPLLLGRSALADRFLVDSSKTFTASESCRHSDEK